MATSTYIGVSSGLFTTPGNWSPSGNPAAGSDIVITKNVTADSFVNFTGANSPLGINIGDTASTQSNAWVLTGTAIAFPPATAWTIPSGGYVQNDGTPVYIGSGQYGELQIPLTYSNTLAKTGTGTTVFRSNLSNTGTGTSGTTLDVQNGVAIFYNGTVPFGTAGSTVLLSGTGVALGQATSAVPGPLNYAISVTGTNAELFNSYTGAMTWSGSITVGASGFIVNMRNPLAAGSVGTLTLSGAVNVSTFGATFTTATAVASSIVVSGIVSGAGPITKSGANTLTLSNANTLTGVVSASAGTLSVTNTNALQDATFQPAAGTVTFPANPRIGGLTGNGTFSASGGGTATLGEASVSVTKNDTFSGSFSSTTLPLAMNSASGFSVQTFSGTSSRASPATTITRGAMQITTTAGLYAASPVGTTTVSSGGGLWVLGGITPNLGPVTINGTGAAGSVDGAVRNVSGNNTLTSTVTLGGSATIQSDAGILTLSTLTLGTANTLTLKTTGFGGITLGAAATGTVTSAISVPSGSTVKAGTTSVLAATTNTITGTFDANTFAQTIASGKTLQVEGTWAGGTTTTTIAGTLDGIGSMTGSGTVSLSTGGALKAGSGAANSTLSIAGPLTFTAGTQSMTLPGGTGTTLSKVAAAGAVTHTGTVTVNATGVSWTSGSTHTFLTYGSKSGAGTFTNGTLSGGTGRQSLGNVAAGATAATFDVVAGNASVTWAGGDGGNWYNGQATGWTGTGVTDFVNGDTATFGANTITAVLTENVSVASLTMNAAAHTISGSFTLTNAGALAVSGASFRQIINVAGEHAAVSVATSAALELGNANVLGSGTTAITLTGTNARLAFNSGANGLSTNRALTFTPGGAFSQYLETSGDASVAITGTVTNGTGATASIVKIGSGLVALTGTNSALAIFRVGDVSVAETAGRNVLRLVNPPGASAAAMRLNGASVLELTSNFSKTYGTAAGQIYLESGAGAGFSAYNASGITVSTAVNFGVSVGSQWNGPMYFGTALSTATGKLTMSGTLAVTASVTVPQTLHVFNGASAGAASSARINTLNSSLNPGFTFLKAGPGALFVVNGNYGATRATMRVSEGAYEVGPTTLNATGNIEIGSGATNAVVRQESSVAATTCPDFAPAPAANFEIEAAGTSTFTLGVLDITSRTVTLSGSGTGVKSSTSGTGAGRYVKTGTGSWELAHAYANLAAGFTGGVEVQAGQIKASKRYALGGGPVALKAGQLRFSDTTTIIGSIASLSTVGQTSTPRIILGA